MFGKKVLLELLKCNDYELLDINRFIEKYKKRYGIDIFRYFLKVLMEEYSSRFPEDRVLENMWYFLIVKVVKQYLTLYNIEYSYEVFYALKGNFTNPSFRLKLSDLRDLELEFLRAGINNNALQELINILNYFLERE
ncbi:MAG: hypothetical protein ACFFAO_13525 [Candidatus Hermodarchaeota archaeon]